MSNENLSSLAILRRRRNSEGCPWCYGNSILDCIKKAGPEIYRTCRCTHCDHIWEEVFTLTSAYAVKRPLGIPSEIFGEPT